jgi:hypothetical protein
MIESWGIDERNPLKAEKLIILADPQRMSRAEARGFAGFEAAGLSGRAGCWDTTAIGKSPPARRLHLGLNQA